MQHLIIFWHTVNITQLKGKEKWTYNNNNNNSNNDNDNSKSNNNNNNNNNNKYDIIVYYFIIIEVNSSSTLLCLYRELTRIAKTQGISFFPIAGQLDKKHHQQWSHLDGKQSRKLLEVLCVPATLQKLVMERSDSSVEMPTVEREHRARFFTKFLSILTRLQYVQRFLASANRNSEDDISCFEAHARELGNQFIDFDKKNSTKWYLHMLVTHVGGQLRQEKSIAPFSCSAQERVNSQHYRMLQTCVQFHASSKQLLSMKRLQVMYEYVQTQFKKDETHYPKDRKSSLSSCVKEKSVPLGEEREEKAKRKKRTLPQV